MFNMSRCRLKRARGKQVGLHTSYKDRDKVAVEKQLLQQPEFDLNNCEMSASPGKG